MNSPSGLIPAALFRDHMVLQQGVPVKVWGRAEPGEKVEVSFNDTRAWTRTDEDGHWEISLLSQEAESAPRDLVIKGKTTVVCRDVLVGEVWLCSGQSNMEFPLSGVTAAARELSEADFPYLRLLSIPRTPSECPLADIACPPWKTCTPDAAKNFSAAAYFFGRELHRRLGVPVGLIDACWGGTNAESWTSLPALRSIAFMGPQLDAYETLIEESRRQQRLFTSAARDLSPDGAWPAMQLPCKWQERGLNFSGAFWFRREVELPSGWAGRDLLLSIGAADKSDITYFNHARVGSLSVEERPDSYQVMRKYPVPAPLVRQGANSISVRVHSGFFDGGLTGPAEAMRLTCPSLPDSRPISLDGDWDYAIEENLGHRNPNSPSELFNGMIAPLTRFPLRGAIWYQGEANVGGAAQYRTLFPRMIEDWREAWGYPFPFYFVQLAGFGPVESEPGESPWAELREAQDQTLALPQTGMATAVDLGESRDIHPRNKQEVGIRLARAALAGTYGRKVAASGPRYESMQLESGKIRLRFTELHGGLVARPVPATYPLTAALGDTAPLVRRGPGGELEGFAICAENQKWVWADARIDGDSVLVWSEKALQPVAVRYAWADMPLGNLYNRAGLPAVPFRTDDASSIAGTTE